MFSILILKPIHKNIKKNGQPSRKKKRITGVNTGKSIFDFHILGFLSACASLLKNTGGFFGGAPSTERGGRLGFGDALPSFLRHQSFFTRCGPAKLYRSHAVFVVGGVYIPRAG